VSAVSVGCVVLVKMCGSNVRELFVKVIRNYDVRINGRLLSSFPFLGTVFISWCCLSVTKFTVPLFRGGINQSLVAIGSSPTAGLVAIGSSPTAGLVAIPHNSIRRFMNSESAYFLIQGCVTLRVGLWATGKLWFVTRVRMQPTCQNAAHVSECSPRVRM
jgi:hypothetical protein